MYKTIRDISISSEGKVFFPTFREFVGITANKENIFLKTLVSPSDAEDDMIVRKFDSSGRVVLPQIILRAYNLVGNTFETHIDREAETITILAHRNMDLGDMYFNYSDGGEAITEKPSLVSYKKYNSPKPHRIFNRTITHLVCKCVCDGERNYLKIRPMTEDDIGNVSHYNELEDYCGVGLQSFWGTEIEYFIENENFLFPALFRKRNKLKCGDDIVYSRYEGGFVTVSLPPKTDVFNKELDPHIDEGHRHSMCPHCAEETKENRSAVLELISLTEKLLKENEELKAKLGAA